MPAKSLLLALFTLMLGLAIGYMIAPTEANPAQVVTVDRGPGVVAAADPKKTADLQAESGGAGRFEAASQVPIPARTMSKERVDRAIFGIQAPNTDPESGEGKIWGEVRTKDGTPLPGATLILTKRQSGSNTAQYPSYGQAAPGEESLEKALELGAQSWAKRRATRLRVMTDAEGAFEFTGLVDGGDYYIRGYLANLSFKVKGGTSTVPVGERCDLVGTAIGLLTFEVVDADGQPMKEALVTLAKGAGNSGKSHGWKADDAPLRVLPGTYEVRAYGEVQPQSGHSGVLDMSLQSEAVTVKIAEKGEESVRLTLNPVVGIRGSVAGGDREWIEVKLVDLASADQYDEKALASSSTETYTQSRRFVFTDLTPGMYAVGIVKGSSRVVAHQIVEVTDGMAETELVIPAPDPSQQLRVTVLDPDGQTLEGVQIGVEHRTGHGSSGYGTRTVSYEDGVYQMEAENGLEEFFDPWPPETSYTLELEHGSYGTVEVDVTEGQREVLHQYQMPATILVEVAGYAKSDMRGRLTVSASLVTEDNWGHRSRGGVAIGSDGRAELKSLVPGEYSVSLGVKTDEWNSITISTQTVNLVAGETTVRFPIPELHKVLVLAPDLEPGTSMWLNRQADENGVRMGRGSQNADVDADGVALFENLAAGTYELRANGSMGRMTIDVPCGEILFEVREPDCLVLDVRDADGTLAMAGFQTGDKIIGIDGKEFEELSDITAGFFGAMGKDVTLTVLRGSTKMDLALKLPNAQGMNDMGGNFEPGNRD